MNITDYLVEYLKQGHLVEIPHVGVLASKETEAFFDKATSTFYPSSKTITLEPVGTAHDNFVQYLADKECVGLNTAQQIWKNYCDALSAKFTAEGCYQLNDLGTIFFEDGSYRYQPSDGINLKAGAQHLHPVADIRQYEGNDYDPFLAFEQPIQQGEVKSTTFMTAKATSITNPTPEPITEPEPAEEPKAIEEPVEQETSEKPVEQEPTEEPVEQEAIEEPAPFEEQEEPALETAIEQEPDENVETSEKTNHTEEPEPIAEPEPEPVDINSQLSQLDAIEQSNNIDDDEPKKRGGFWKAIIWIVALLIIIVACAFVIDRYLFNSQGREWVSQYIPVLTPATTNAEIEAIFPEVDTTIVVDNITPYTYSLEGLQFSEVELDLQRDAIIETMTPYLKDYLKRMKHLKEEEAFMYLISDYIDKRLTEETTDNGFYPQQMLTYKDYVREAMMPTIKDIKLKRKSSAIRAELLNSDILGNILSEILPDEILPEDPGMQPAHEAKATPKDKQPAPATSQIATTSKKGFDIIAGAYANKSTADQMCRRLKAKGCGAYLINKNGLYYVSMGSAATRTEADAMFNHIKEWYKEDISIKKW